MARAARRSSARALEARRSWQVLRGRPYPLGATWDGEGVNFALFSAHAEQVELCLFAADDPGVPEGVPPALATRLRRAYRELRTLAARQEATLAPLLAAARAPVLAEVPLLSADPGSLADLASIGTHLFPGAPHAAAPARGLGG